MTPNEQDKLTEAYYALYPVIRRAAKSVAFQWPGVIEADDAEQMIAERLWSHPASLLKVAAMESAPQYRAVVGVGHQLASQERTDYDHYKGSYKYSVDEVKSLLSRGVLTADVQGFNDAVLDLMEGLGAMIVKTPQYVDAITSRYADGEVPKSTTAKDALKNGLTALTNAMNGSARRRHSERDDGPGTRTVLTNAQAYAISTHQYDGGPEVSPESFTGGYR